MDLHSDLLLSPTTSPHEQQLPIILSWLPLPNLVTRFSSNQKNLRYYFYCSSRQRFLFLPLRQHCCRMQRQSSARCRRGNLHPKPRFRHWFCLVSSECPQPPRPDLPPNRDVPRHEPGHEPSPCSWPDGFQLAWRHDGLLPSTSFTASRLGLISNFGFLFWPVLANGPFY
jgi:hypothetical protein